MQKLKMGSRKGVKKEEKKLGASSEWVQFKDLMLCSGDFGEVECSLKQLKR